MHIAPAISHAAQPAAASPPQTPSAGLLRMTFGNWLEQLGAIGGGTPVARNALELRFESNRDAVLASAALNDTIDGVQLLVRRQDGSAPRPEPITSGDAAMFVSQIRDLLDVAASDSALIVTAERPEVNAKLDWLLRDEVAGLQVRWRTAEPVPALSA